jgi:hypothetical protein
VIIIIDIDLIELQPFRDFESGEGIAPHQKGNYLKFNQGSGY